jgi:hypothetical protein
MNAQDALVVLDSVIQRSGHIVACDVVQARAFFADLVKREAELAGVVVALHEAISTFSITNQGAAEAGAVDTVGFLLEIATKALDRRASSQEPQA